MITLSDIRRQAQNHYEKWLAEFAYDPDAAYLPLVITRIGDTAAPTAQRAELLQELSNWQKGESRTYGLNIQLSTPSQRSKKYESKIVAISVETTGDLLALLDKQAEFIAYQSALQSIKETAPQLADWCALHVRDIIRHLDKWPQLLEIVQYFQLNPQVNLPIKLLPFTLSDSKFFEKNNAIICSLLDEIVPKAQINFGESSCARRYQLPEHAPMLTVFWNDTRLKRHFHGFSLLSFDLEELAHKSIPCKKVIITENRTSAYQLLQYPLPDTCIVFGTGYGAELLCKLLWLNDVQLWYWGDLDTHGLHIYSRVQRYFPHIQPLMMDTATLQAHCDWLAKGKPFRHKLPKLSHAPEQELFEYLLKEQLRLEQERISPTWVEQALSRAGLLGS